MRPTHTISPGYASGFVSRAGMGVDVTVWRQRIGSFGGGKRGSGIVESSEVHGARGGVELNCWHCVLVVWLVLAMCGDVESNPGPKKTGDVQIDKYVCRTIYRALYEPGLQRASIIDASYIYTKRYRLKIKNYNVY
jgi:hypothetical protein